MRQVKEQVNLDNLHLEHVAIQSELRYLIGAKVAGTVNGTAGGVQHGQKTLCLYPVKVTTTPGHCGSGFRLGLEPNQTKLPAKNRTTDGLLGPVAKTSQY